jgi:hypothetical protein
MIPVKLGHHDIREDQAGGRVINFVDGLDAILRRFNIEPLFFQGILHHGQLGRTVVYDKDGEFTTTHSAGLPKEDFFREVFLYNLESFLVKHNFPIGGN